ncbi:MAG: hypothetical protein K6F05_01635 [Succinivibrio sp.]|nr:hypothetical protein [Succinivibrio sp.]
MERAIKIKAFLGLTLWSLGLVLTGCSTTPPEHPENLCSIFQEKDEWYVAAHKVHDKYGIPINVAMAIMAQESGFREDAKPPMRWFLFIPYGRGSSSYGYAQAQDEVWSDYTSEEGGFFSSRDNFGDALDFIGWYMTKTQKVNGISFSDAYNQYLNYHEGWTGFKKETYRGKDWLKNVAAKVANRSENYKQQLLKCNLY